jgi:hypothetical protein
MRRFAPGARIAGRACGLLALLMTGCMPLGYAFPTVSYVRPASVGAVRDEVHAFRVDIADDECCFDIPEHDRYVLKPLALHSDGSFDAQMKISADYGWFVDCVAVIYGSARHHTVLVRLYRPGYQVLELESWHKEAPLQWTPAPTPLDQEQAIDNLVSTWNTSPQRLQNQYAFDGFIPPRDAIIFRYLAPGSASKQHRESLLFAVGEYERLLKEANDAKLRARLEEKIVWLQQLAAR